ncbi:MAG: flagellar hook protein FlgE [Beijerinckiaceae bacterium]|nr:flagellar hook protein FlgE [Beijerinckiaceae bacterium]
MKQGLGKVGSIYFSGQPGESPMSLYSAIYASVSGMRAQSYLLSTVSENISNSNTIGYKQASTLFQDMVAQYDAAAGYTAGGVRTTVRYNIDEQGSLMGTTSGTDIAIQGRGYFLVNDSNGGTFLTRAGSFVPDASGNLVNAAGFTLMGYSLAPGASGFTGSTAGLVPVNINGTALVAAASTQGTFTANVDSNAVIVTGAPSATNYTTKSSVVAYDNLGNAVTLDIFLAKTGANTWQIDVYDHTNLTTPLTSATLNFNPADGTLSSPASLSIAVPGGNTVSLNIADMTQLASPFAVTAATMDGNAPSQVKSVSINTDGTLSFVYANGKTIPAYDIPLGNVPSPDNMLSLRGDVFQVSSHSGDLVIGRAGTGGLGAIHSFALETSTVDLATQLTEMIVAQRGYESNSKVFQTGSEMLGTLISMLT